MRGVDITVPERMGELVHDLGWYDHVFQQHADIPVGFWPKGNRLRPLLVLQFLTNRTPTQIRPFLPLANWHGWSLTCLSSPFDPSY
jgi:hypothetical protein